MFESTGLWIVWIVLQCTAIAVLALLLLFALRRVLPETRGRIALAGLAAMSGILLLGLLPGGGWFAGGEVTLNPTPAVTPPQPTAQEPATSETPLSEAIPGEVAPADDLEAEALAARWQRLSGWFTPAVEQTPPVVEAEAEVVPAVASDRTIWLRWVLFALAAVQLVAIARIAAGFWAVWRLRSRAAVCDDEKALATLQRLINQSGVRRPVELMISSEVSTPAMLGWRRITILLPPEYTEWTPDQLQAVLAHELAHVARRDGLWRTIAALLQSLHFYNPLAHLLARRYVLEQELAADRLACQWLGQRETYLQSVANLALGRKAPKVAWSTLAFLPSRSTLVRRLEMLRYMPDSIPRPVERTLQAAALLVLAAATVAIGGLRPLGAQPPAERPEAATEEKSTQRLAEFVPAELGHMVVEINFAELMKSAEFAQMLAAPEEEDPLNPSPRKLLQEAFASIPPEQVESILIVAEAHGPVPFQPTVLIKSKEEIDFQKLAEQMEQPSGPSMIRIPQGWALAVRPDVLAYSFLDGSPFVISEFLKREDQRNSIAQALPPTDALFRLSLDWTQIGPMMLAEPGFANSPIQVMIAPLTRPAKRWTLEVRDRDESIEATLSGQFDDAKQAERAQETILALRPLLQNLHQERDRMLEESSAPPDAIETFRKLLKLSGQLLESAEAEVRETEMVVTAQAEGPLDSLLAFATPPLQVARLAFQRMQDTNDMLQVLLAFHNYADTHGHFPPVVTTDPETGQKRSWRVELLPFLGPRENELYQQYRKDEPWDSESNRLVLNKMPEVYKSARQLRSTTTSLYAVTGKDTALHGEKPKISDFTFGLSNTVLLVHTDRETPWTKPEDIPLEEATPENLGGFHAGVFIVGMADGSVKLVASTIDPQVWKKVLIRNSSAPFKPLP